MLESEDDHKMEKKAMTICLAEEPVAAIHCDADHARATAKRSKTAAETHSEGLCYSASCASDGDAP